MSNLIKQASFLGNTKTIVGDGTADLVLNTLGKVFVKIGRNTKVLTDLFSLLDTSTSSGAKITIVNSDTELSNLDYPGDGYFVYNSLTQILYICYNEAYVAIIQGSQYKQDNYVKKSGDSMSGQLEITTSKAPLIVASKQLVKNLNAQYLNGYSGDDFAKKKVDETIQGAWTFTNTGTSEGNWIFKSNIRAYKDYITSGSLSSPSFSSGFAGYGWRLDASQNMLTIDYLVVRKAMRVYEMVINKISATNGSLWITNSSKCDSAIKPTVSNLSDTDFQETGMAGLANNTYYFFDLTGYFESKTIGDKTYKIYKYLFKIADLTTLISESSLTSINDFKTLLTNVIAGTATNSQLSFYSIDTELDRDAIFPVYVDNQAVSKSLYYGYFAYDVSTSNNYWIINTDKDEYPLFNVGDIIRCQKYTDGQIKYYDALVVKQIEARAYVMQKALSVFDVYTAIEYDEEGNIISSDTKYNTTQYNKTNQYYDSETGTTKDLIQEKSDGDGYETGYDGDSYQTLDDPASGDDMIQVGNIQDPQRQNAIYLTSTDEQGPYIDIISGLNRPDYSVIYDTPKFIKYRYANGEYYVKIITDATNTDFIGYFTLDTYNNPTKVEEGTTNCIMLAKSTTCAYKETVNSVTTVKECLKQLDSNGNVVHASTKTTQVRVGNLSGIYDSIFPATKQPSGFGLYGQNVFLTGEFYLNNGKSVVDFSQDQILLQFGTAGLKISEVDGKSVIKLVGDQIYIVTYDTSGNEVFTALFEEGKIKASFIDVDILEAHNVYCTKDFFVEYDAGETPTVGTVNAPTSSINLYGDGQLALYYPPVYYNMDPEKFLRIKNNGNYKEVTGDDNVTYLSQIIKIDKINANTDDLVSGITTIFFDSYGDILHKETYYTALTATDYFGYTGMYSFTNLSQELFNCENFNVSQVTINNETADTRLSNISSGKTVALYFAGASGDGISMSSLINAQELLTVSLKPYFALMILSLSALKCWNESIVDSFQSNFIEDYEIGNKKALYTTTSTSTSIVGMKAYNHYNNFVSKVNDTYNSIDTQVVIDDSLVTEKYNKDTKVITKELNYGYFPISKYTLTNPTSNAALLSASVNPGNPITPDIPSMEAYQNVSFGKFVNYKLVAEYKLYNATYYIDNFKITENSQDSSGNLVVSTTTYTLTYTRDSSNNVTAVNIVEAN